MTAPIREGVKSNLSLMLQRSHQLLEGLNPRVDLQEALLEVGLQNSKVPQNTAHPLCAMRFSRAQLQGTAHSLEPE